MSLRSPGSSVDKGESLKDTALTLAAYDPDVIVVRHPQIGAPQLVARLHRRARRQRRRRQAPAPDAGAPRPLHDARGARPARRPPRRDRRRRPALARGALARPGARARRRARRVVGPPTLIPRGIEALGCDGLARHRRDRATRTSSTSCACSTSAWWRGVRAVAARVHRALGITPERVRAGPDRDASRADESRRRDRSAVADSEAALVTEQVRVGLVVRMAVLYDLLTAGPRGASRERVEVALMLVARNGRSDNARRSRRARRRPDRRDRRARSTSRSTDGVIAAPIERRHRRDGRARARAGVRRPTRPPPHARPRGRGDDRSGTAAAAAGGYCAILAMPNTEPSSTRRPFSARSSSRRARRRSCRPASWPRSARASSARSSRRWPSSPRRRGRLHGRRPAGRLGRPHAPRAAVQRRHRPSARAPLRGAVAVARRACARGRGRRGAGLRG